LWTKWHWGTFSTSASVSSANSHFTNYSIFIYHPINTTSSHFWQRRYIRNNKSQPVILSLVRMHIF
jgi:hypothetical protein